MIHATVVETPGQDDSDELWSAFRRTHMIDRKDFLDTAIQKLCSVDWTTAQERDALPASLSHWMQSPQTSIPFMSKTMQMECEAIARQMTQPLISGVRRPGSPNTLKEGAAAYQAPLPFSFRDVPYPPPAKWKFTFIDLFAGIGGFRIAFQKAGGKCLFTSEWDKYAQKTYEANFGEYPYGDIRQTNKSEIPDHDVLCAGFPCQPFSLAGVSKKNSLGRKHGFDDETQGTLFFEIKEILRIKRPKAFMLENVKNLLSHDRGKTFEVIRHALEDVLGYVINWKIVDGAKWLPQHRERVFIVGYDPNRMNITKEEIVIPDRPSSRYSYPELRNIIRTDVTDHTLGPGTWDTLMRHKAHHEKAGNGFGYGLHTMPISEGQVTRTISARYHKDGAEVLIEQPGNRPRRLTVKEAMQLQGYDPGHFVFPVSDTQAYRQIGNSVIVPAVAASARKIAEIIRTDAR